MQLERWPTVSAAQRTVDQTTVVPVLRTLACALCLASCLLTGCGGSGTDSSKLATATPPSDAEAPRGIDVAAVNRARDAFVAACKARDTGDQSGSLTAVRQAAAILVRE